MKKAVRSISFGLTILILCSVFSVGVFAGSAKTKGSSKRQYYYSDLGNNTVELTGIKLSENDYNAERLVIKIPAKANGKAVVKIGNSAFKSVKIPYSVVLPNVVREIGKQAFAKTRLLDVTLSNSLRIIGSGAFRDTDLTSAKLGKRLKRIGIKAFYNTEISKITLPKRIKYVGKYAFCTDKTLIKSVSIPKNIKKIGYNAFSSTSAKTKIMGYTGTLSEAYAQKYNYKFYDVQTKLTKDKVNYKSLVAKSCRTELKTISSTSSGIVNLEWNKTTSVNNMSGVSEYQILIADNPDFNNARKIILKHGYSAAVKELKSSVVYYVKIRGVVQIRMKWFWGSKYSYAKDFNGAWSTVKTVKTA